MSDPGPIAPAPAARLVRVVDLETTGTAEDGAVIEIGWQDVRIEPDGTARLVGDTGARLIDPGRKITPATSAIHHIVDEDVVGAPHFLEIAERVLRPDGGVVAFAAHRASFERRWCTDRLTGGVPWICTYKSALRVWPDAPTHSNQGLRYWRRPDGLDRARGLPAHRAGPDAYVTAHLLAAMLGASPLEDLLAWSREPALLVRVPYGPDRGVAFAALPVERLEHHATRGGDVAFSARHALARLAGAAPSAGPPPGPSAPGDLFGTAG